MRVPVSWLRDYVDLPADLDVKELADRLTFLGLKLEALEAAGSDVAGPLLVGRVLSFESETHSNGRTIRWCQVDVGEPQPRGIVCGAANFAEGDLVVVCLPGAVLAGGFEIAARTTYGHVSDGMICSARELGLGDDHSGIIVLEAGSAEVGADAAELLHLRDDVIEFEINPDRAYALSVRGVARETATAYGLSFRDPALTLPAVQPGDGYPVSVQDPVGCDVFVALMVEGFDASRPSPPWLARRVQLAGMRPISLAVDVTNYVMLELGQPIHGYDKASLQGPIVVRRAAPGEKLTTLDGVTRTLDQEDLLITDDRGPIGLAGVMGGQETEMGAATTSVVVEAAHFDPVAIARGTRRHKLPSEASKRFERGIDPTIGPVAARRVADLLVLLGGGRVASSATIVGTPRDREPITIDAQLTTRVAGFPIDDDTAAQALRAVGCEVTRDGMQIAATPAAWRPDINDPHDLAEEVLRIVGYQNVPSILPAAPAGRGMTKQQRLRRRIGVALAASGYVEVLAYPFIGGRELDDLGLDADDERRATVRVANPLSEEEPLLRSTLVPGLLRTLARNVSRAQTDVGLFELGSVFLPGLAGRPKAPLLGVDRAPTVDEQKALEAALPDQPLHLGLVVSGRREARGWWGDGHAAGWADAVEAAREVARAVGITVDVRAAQSAPWHPGRCAQVLVDETPVGYAGELHPNVCSSYGVPPRTSALELDLDALLQQAPDLVLAPEFSSYPVGKEDVALVVGADIPAADVEAALRLGAGELLESVRMFDLYTGDQVGTGKKSIAYALRFRAPDRTLTEAEIKSARDAAVAMATARTGAVQRS
jgi:phenylalanyl-tRNA synthetase beta chain